MIPLLGVHPKELEGGTENRHWHTRVIAALFAVARRQRQPARPSVDEWDSTWSVHTTEYYSALQRKEMLTPARTGQTSRTFHRGKEASPGTKPA